MKIAIRAFIGLVLTGACAKERPDTEAPAAAAADQPDLPISEGEADPADSALDHFFTNSVLERLDGFKSEDAGDLAKIKAAFAKADKEMYVHVSREIDRSVYRPSPRRIGNTDYGGAGGYWPAEEKWSADAKGLLKFGGVPVGTYKKRGGNWIKIHRPDGYPPPLAKNTPGIVWHVDGNTVWFVAFDGGRYRLEWEDLAVGLPAKSAWPKPLQHALLSDEDVDFLGRTGAMPKASHDALTGINNAFNKCAEDGWEGFDKEIDKLAKKNLTWSTRAQRADLAYKKREESVKKTCAKHVDAMDAALVKIIDERNAKRRALFDQMSRKGA